MSDKKLTAITDITELCQLRDMYLVDWPKNCSGYECLNNFIRWLNRQPSIKNVNIYTLDSDWKTHGFYLVLDRYQLFISSLLGSDDINIKAALSLIDWSGGIFISSMPARYYAAVTSFLGEKNLQKYDDSVTCMYYMPQAQANQLQIDCPKGYTTRDLCEEDAETIDSAWPNNHNGSHFLIKRAIVLNASAGVYKSDTNELVAWCIRLQGGFLGALQVKDNYKRLGLGSVVTRSIARKIALIGDDVTACVNPDNVASRRMFDKLGFTVIDECYWIGAGPIEAGTNWPVNQ